MAKRTAYGSHVILEVKKVHPAPSLLVTWYALRSNGTWIKNSKFGMMKATGWKLTKMIPEVLAMGTNINMLTGYFEFKGYKRTL